MNGKILKRLLCLIVLCKVASFTCAQSTNTLNSIFSSYSSSIKVSNPQNTKSNSCIYNTNYLRAELQGNYLVLSFGFAWDASRREYIDTDVLKINLRTATFCTGSWTLLFGKWQHGGDKSTLSIQDKVSGMDLAITGCQSYNRGTKNIMIDQLWFSFGSEALANRVLNEINNIQAGYKEKEPWLCPAPEPIPSVPAKVESTKSKPKPTPKPQQQASPSPSAPSPQTQEPILPSHPKPKKPDRSM